MFRQIIPLEQIRVATPCPASWAAMYGDDHVRFCALCQKNVYNLSALDSAGIQALIQEHEGRLCVRYYQRRDGTVLTADCPIGLRRARRWLGGVIAAVVAACFAAALFGNESAKRPLGKQEVLTRLREIEALEPLIEWLDPTPRPAVAGALMRLDKPVHAPEQVPVEGPPR